MKEKIIDVINGSAKNLNSIEIIKCIKKEYSAEDLREVLDILDSLCKEGIIICKTDNTYKMNDLIMGILDVHEKGNAHLLMKGETEDIFIPRNKMLNARNKDRVLVEITNVNSNEGRVVKILDRSLGKCLGEVINDNGKLKVICLSDDLGYDVIVEDSDLNLVEGMIVKLKYVKDLSKHSVLASVDRIITHKNAPTKDILMIAAGEFDIPTEFSDEALKEAASMPRELSQEEINKALASGVKDFRDDIVFTIDGKDTKDIDDAISTIILPNGNFRLSVHIADVSRYVTEDTTLWKEAGERGNSNYLGPTVIPMLPVELSNGICSLNPNVDRFCVSAIMEIDRSGKIVNKDICLGIINSRKKMNYDAVQDILENKETEDTETYKTLPYIANENDTLEKIAFENNMTVDELKEYNKDLVLKKGASVNIPVRSIIKNMQVLSKTLKGKMQRRGEIDFISDEVKLVTDEENKVIDIKARVQREAEELIENFMIAANEAVATTMAEMNVPAPYRVHDVPSGKKIEDYFKFLSLLGIQYTGIKDFEHVSSLELQHLLEYLKDKDKFKMLNKKLLRSMQKAIYSTENIGHFGLASSCYTHFTSPIRRYSDLMLHKCIREYIVNENFEDKFLEEWYAYLVFMCDHVSKTERTSEKCEYAVDDMLVAEYMEGIKDEEGNVIREGHIGDEYDGTIDSCLPNGFFVETDNLINGKVSLDTLEEHVNYNENLLAYTNKKNRVIYSYGDRVRVKCIGASKEKRQVDFALVRK